MLCFKKCMKKKSNETLFFLKVTLKISFLETSFRREKKKKTLLTFNMFNQARPKLLFSCWHISQIQESCIRVHYISMFNRVDNELEADKSADDQKKGSHYFYIFHIFLKIYEDLI